VKRIRWYADATRHQLEKWLKRTAKSDEDSQQPSPLKLSDYRWPWAVEQFRQHVARVRPKAIICQYVTMAYLLDALSIADRKHILCVLDTHDILHDRGMQFHSAGYLHWLEISEKEEVDVWNRFDAVIAIQPQEAERIRAAVTQPEVIVAGHAQRRPLRLSRREHPEKPRRLHRFGELLELARNKSIFDRGLARLDRPTGNSCGAADCRENLRLV
jgi:hypothetical protein